MIDPHNRNLSEFKEVIEYRLQQLYQMPLVDDCLTAATNTVEPMVCTPETGQLLLELQSWLTIPTEQNIAATLRYDLAYPRFKTSFSEYV